MTIITHKESGGIVEPVTVNIGPFAELVPRRGIKGSILREEEKEGDTTIDNVSQDYNQRFMMNVNRFGKDPKYRMTFDYSFQPTPFLTRV